MCGGPGDASMTVQRHRVSKFPNSTQLGSEHRQDEMVRIEALCERPGCHNVPFDDPDSNDYYPEMCAGYRAQREPIYIYIYIYGWHLHKFT